MRLEGYGKRQGFEPFYWQWFSGQGGYAELATALNNLPCLSEPIRGDMESTKARWKELWPVIQYDVAKQMEHPSARAVILLQYDCFSRATLWISYPGCGSKIECRASVTPVGDYSAAELAKGKDTGVLFEPQFMEEMPVKFWDPQFANKVLSQKPLPPPPGPMAAAAPPPVPVGANRPRSGAFSH
jgi:hypothetical protein